MPINTVSRHNILTEYKKYKHLSMVIPKMTENADFRLKLIHTYIQNYPH